MAGHDGNHPDKCPKCGAAPWESCENNDKETECFRISHISNEPILERYDNGSFVVLRSYSGGGSKVGSWGELELAFIDSIGKRIVRKYRDIGIQEQPEEVLIGGLTRSQIKEVINAFQEPVLDQHQVNHFFNGMRTLITLFLQNDLDGKSFRYTSPPVPTNQLNEKSIEEYLRQVNPTLPHDYGSILDGIRMTVVYLKDKIEKGVLSRMKLEYIGDGKVMVKLSEEVLTNSTEFQINVEEENNNE